eukprot:TRINITY_DN7346_c0_g1_i1.p1 TRINITY_DN7346_c0_g1~~TRINITY_DN7346_c0_g1_i1.p1  ORF type:complete len:785 (+),score=195.35 TRINITY_DN7346_c0_g1_i1:176-2530(+)
MMETNYKADLQHLLQSQGKLLPTYKSAQQGPSHQPKFTTTVSCENQHFEGTAASKKASEQQAAKAAVEALRSLSLQGDDAEPGRKKTNPKSPQSKVALLEYCAKRGISRPEFKSSQVGGSSHEPKWVVKMLFNNEEYESDPVKSVKEGEELAAKKAYAPILAELQQQSGRKHTRREVEVKRSEENAPNPPVKSPARGYQTEMYQLAMKENILCFMPTGAGKTLVSAMVVKRMHELNPEKKVVFLVDRIPLVKQQTAYLHRETGLKAVAIHGDMDYSSAAAQDWLWTNDVFVIIAAVFETMLAADILSMKDFSLVVFDEAHHAVKNHPFAKILDHYYKPMDRSPLKPKILGLTASPAVEETTTLTMFEFGNLCTTLHVNIKMPVTHRDELKSLVNAPKPEIIEAQFQDEEKHFLADLAQLNEEATLLSKETILFKGVDDSEDERDDNEMLEDEQNETSFAKSMDLDWMSEIDQIRSDLANFGFNAAVLRLQTFLDGLVEKEKLSSGLRVKLDLHIKSHTTDRQPFDNNSKVHKLIEFLQKEVKEDEFKTIVFVKTRETAIKLNKIIADVQMEHIRPTFVVGKAAKKNHGMSMHQQNTEIEEFRENKKNLLVCTSVLEEGFDLPACNLVIRFDCPSTALALIQSRGRARKSTARFVAIVRTNEKNEFQKLLEREKTAMEAADCLQNGKMPELDKRALADPISELYQQCLKALKLTDIMTFEDPSSYGEEHSRTFETILVISGASKKWKGMGSSKHEAKKDAAANALKDMPIVKIFLENLHKRDINA